MNRAIKIGKFPKKMLKKVKEKEEGELSDGSGDERIDPQLVESILQSYLSSNDRRSALQNPLDVLEQGQEDLFLALEMFVRGNGVRLDTIRNLTCHEIGKSIVQHMTHYM